MEHFLSKLQKVVKENWDRTALSNFQGESFTYSDTAKSIKKFHLLFEKLGIKRGDKISLCAKNTARWAIAYLSSNTYQSVIVPILLDFTPDSVAALINHSESKFLFIDKDKWQHIDPKDLENIIAVLDADTWEALYCKDKDIEDTIKDLDKLFEAEFPKGFGPEDVCYPTDNPEDLCTINYTSGSTGNPKGVMLSYKNFSAVIEYIVKTIPASPKDKIVSMLPMAHMYGLVIEFLYPVCCGVSIYWLAKAPTPTLLLKALAEVKPFLFISVPLVIEKIFKSKIKPVLDKPSMRILACIPGINKFLYSKIRKSLLNAFGTKVKELIFGGAALNPEVEKYLHKIDLPYVVGYGMTEACPLIAYINYPDYVMGSCGRAIDCNDVRIDSADPANIVGEIQAKGDNVCMGYYKNPEATKALFTEDGYLHTGDLGVMDAEGNIFIKGRSKNMILGSSGQNIYPEEIEAIINNQDFVLETVVVSREGRLVALVYPDMASIDETVMQEEDKSKLPEQIRIASNKLLPGYSQLSEVEFVDKPFEKTPKMSIRRFLYS